MARKFEVHTYRCINTGCRKIEKEGGIKKSSIKCSCGSNINHIKTVKE